MPEGAEFESRSYSARSPRGGLERQCRRLFRACHQHDFVAIDLPCRSDDRLQELFAETASSEGSVCHDVLDQSIWLSAAR